LKPKKKSSTKASAPDSRATWLERAGKMKPAKRVPFIERALRELPKTPTKSNVFFRKRLVRFLDASRLEAGLVSPAELHKENSPFAQMDFRPRLLARK
jgi:aminoglycoside phosphotransferase